MHTIAPIQKNKRYANEVRAMRPQPLFKAAHALRLALFNLKPMAIGLQGKFTVVGLRPRFLFIPCRRMLSRLTCEFTRKSYIRNRESTRYPFLGVYSQAFMNYREVRDTSYSQSRKANDMIK
jgi:hypothetical protein